VIALRALYLLAAAPAAAAADVEYGRYLASECVTCHQASGGDQGIPSIVGWPQSNFVAAFDAYRSGERDHAVMRTIAGRYSDEETAALAAYFATLGN
jgi:cytochrome c